MEKISDTAQEIVMMNIKINDNTYQVPAGVVHAFKKLEEEIKSEQKAHAKTQELYENLKGVNSASMAQHILYNLAEGLPPKKFEREKWGVEPSFNKEYTCLIEDAYNNPAFRSIALQRIMQGICGRKNNGENFK